jgi:hypothetical protein
MLYSKALEDLKKLHSWWLRDQSGSLARTKVVVLAQVNTKATRAYARAMVCAGGVTQAPIQQVPGILVYTRTAADSSTFAKWFDLAHQMLEKGVGVMYYGNAGCDTKEVRSLRFSDSSRVHSRFQLWLWATLVVALLLAMGVYAAL